MQKILKNLQINVRLNAEAQPGHCTQEKHLKKSGFLFTNNRTLSNNNIPFVKKNTT